MISKIRDFLTQHGLDALIIARTDSFLGEHYPPEKNQLLKATGFSGSAGFAVITQTQAVLITDARYTEQAKIESDFTVLETPTQTTPSQWLSQNLSGCTIGYYPEQHSAFWVGYMENCLQNVNTNLKGLSQQEWNLLLPPDKIKTKPDEFDYDLAYCGIKTADKIKQITDILNKQGIDAFLFGAPDSVSWILNKRSSWVPDYPLIFKRLIVFKNGDFRELTDTALSKLKKQTIGIDLTTVSEGLCQRLKHHQIRFQHMPDIVAPLKAVKNPIEQNNIRQACFNESVTLCRFLAWVEDNKTVLTEWDCEVKLKQLRAENPLYRGDSFDTIAASGEHAARAHYHATKEKSSPLNKASLLLIDTGGNYLNGTTDMTRTICIGQPTKIMKRRYTQVIKGHIALALTELQSGDLPHKLDKNAHAFLRADGVDYLHATGHGIGLFSDVHEAPPVIHEKSDTPIVAGMLFSNEPAYYDAQAGFGIRLENMILTHDGENGRLILENLIWVPFDGRLIDFDLLTSREKGWLKSYHTVISNTIMPRLTDEEQSIIQPLLDFFLEIR